MEKLNLLKNWTCIMVILITISSCSKEGLSEPDLKNKTEEVEYLAKSNTISGIAKLIVDNLKNKMYNSEVLEANSEEYFNIIESYDEERLSINEISTLLESNFGINESSSIDLFIIAVENKEILSQEGARDLLISEMQNEINQLKSQSVNSRVFSFLHSLLADDETHCSMLVLAHIADAMLGTAVAAATAPTGVGAAFAGSAVASSVGSAVIAAHNCN